MNNYDNYDYVITKPELNEDTLAHYGVLGMKWGVRKDIKNTGAVSKKTKTKIKKAVGKAKYAKMRRLLNGLEDLKADYKGDKEHNKEINNKYGVKDAEKNLRTIESISKEVSKTAKTKGYQYNKVKTTRPTSNTRNIVGTSNMIGTFTAGPLGGLVAGAGASAYTKKKDKDYRDKTGSINSKYWVYDTDAYKRKKK